MHAIIAFFGLIILIIFITFLEPLIVNIIHYYVKTAILFSRVTDNIFQYFCRVKYLVKICRAILSIWSGRSILLIWPGNFLLHFHNFCKNYDLQIIMLIQQA